MRDSYSKRKSHHGSDDRPFKKSKGGSNGKWQTPHHKAKLEALRAKGLEPGDVGLATTCVKGKERQALDELMDICEEYGATLYNLKTSDDVDEEDADEDIESSIKKEVQSLKPSSKPGDKDTEAPFEPIRLGLDCLLFMRTHAPVDPVELAHRICIDARDGVGKDKGGRRSRFLNRFTPVTASAKATEAGLDEVAKKVLGEHFRLASDSDEGDEGEKDGGDEKKEEEEGKEIFHSYAIRPTFRAHNLLKREDVIKKVAGFIDTRHKVNLTAPDKVILIDVYQSFFGMSVVGGDWDSLKRYNLHEIHMAALKTKSKPMKEVKEKEGEEEVQVDKPEPEPAK
ncbi:uncharacterized protein GGS22DRAFT_78151 [Annulohypoxylon maeteangense]|uniref:uncharacterized protein n=1 Tax=Annulohypoxylon maeteangense TaxID=1927788 RepID=UPI0020080879|nr:uncharacterized protein GGS22DRAFT_78151 [Annulohypoxylon maeteangense]KAI0880945.1 hypothetical protein GGS22DRAFT_78151 [Annulohypoxylon maeteangense]